MGIPNLRIQPMGMENIGGEGADVAGVYYVVNLYWACIDFLYYSLNSTV